MQSCIVFGFVIQLTHSRGLPVHQAIQVSVESWALLVHLVSVDLPVTLAVEGVKEKMVLKVLVVHRVRLVTRVFRGRLERKVKRETSDKKVPSVQPALLESRAHLVPKVSRVNPEPRDRKVLKALKVKLETLDHPDHLDKTELTAKEDQLDPKVKKANRVFKDRPDREEWLDRKVLKEAQAIQVSQDPTVNRANKVQKVNQEKTVWTAKRARPVIPVKPELQVKWDCQDRRVNLDRRGRLVFKAALDCLVTRATKVPKGCRVHKDHQEIKVSMDLKDLLDFADLQVQR